MKKIKILCFYTVSFSRNTPKVQLFCKFQELHQKSQIKIYHTTDTPMTPPSQFCSHFYDSAESNEKSIFPIFIDRVISDCIYNLRVAHRDFQMCHQPKNKWSFITEEKPNELKRMKNQF